MEQITQRTIANGKSYEQICDEWRAAQNNAKEQYRNKQIPTSEFLKRCNEANDAYYEAISYRTTLLPAVNK